MSWPEIKKNSICQKNLTLISKIFRKKIVEKKGGVWRPPPQQTFFSSKIPDSNALDRKSLARGVPKIQGGSQNILRINCGKFRRAKNAKKIQKNTRHIDLLES